MESELIKELKSKSDQANESINRLKAKIEQLKALKQQGSSTSDDVVVKNLQNENLKLKQQVESLKKDLIALDGVQPTNVTTAVATAKPTPAPAVVQQQQKQQQAKGNQEGKKTNDEKKQEKKAAAAAAPAAAAVDPASVDVSKLDLRIGRITECQKHPEADALYVEQIDLGEAKPRNVCSGLVKFIPLEEMQNRLVVLVCNLKPAKLRGVLSEAMVLCASTPEKVELLIPPEGAQVGDRVTVAGYDSTPEKEINAKNNIFALVQPDLKTNDKLEATYKGVPLEIKSKGVIKTSTLKNVPVK